MTYTYNKNIDPYLSNPGLVYFTGPLILSLEIEKDLISGC